MINWNALTNTDLQLVLKIVARALKMKLILKKEKVDLDMDISAVQIKNKLNLQKLLGFPDFDFAHDVCGMQRHIDRETGELKNCFCPRCGFIKKD